MLSHLMTSIKMALLLVIALPREKDKEHNCQSLPDSATGLYKVISSSQPATLVC
jgi:hypothetical protein